MEPVYVTGHKNPDTDSIVAAIAYASLMNALGERQYVASRIGTVSDETQRILERFGFEAPERLYNVRTQVRDISFDRPPILSSAVTVHRAWESILNEGAGSSARPVADDDGKLFGMITAGDIAEYDLTFVNRARLEHVPLFNLLSCLDGQLWGKNEVATEISGELRIAVAMQQGRERSLHSDMILITGNDSATLREAFEAKVGCIIVCDGQLEPEWLEQCGESLVITTPYDAYRAARLVIQSIPVSRIVDRNELIYFHLDDYVDDVREETLKSRFRCYPILDADDHVVGTLSRFHLLRPNRKKVVLVDHNELAQSVDGLSEAEILGIIDHHRLADVQTTAPVYMRNEPVGSTCTIITAMFQEKGIMPSRKLAGLLAAGIVSDTIFFKSPTCTPRDRLMASRMAALAGLELEELGKFIFSVGTDTAPDLKSLLFSDYKQFQIAGHSIGIGQITCIDSDDILKHRNEFLTLMETERAARNHDILLLMVTDVLKEGTKLLVTGDTEEVEQAFNVKLKDGGVFLPGVMSRKKQVVPTLSILWG